MKKCKCTFTQKIIGDGCDICNPQLLIYMLQETIIELEQRIAELETPKTCKQCLHHSIETEHYGLCHRNGFPEDTAYYWTCGGFIPKDIT